MRFCRGRRLTSSMSRRVTPTTASLRACTAAATSPVLVPSALSSTPLLPFLLLMMMFLLLSPFLVVPMVGAAAVSAVDDTLFFVVAVVTGMPPRKTSSQSSARQFWPLLLAKKALDLLPAHGGASPGEPRAFPAAAKLACRVCWRVGCHRRVRV